MALSPPQLYSFSALLLARVAPVAIALSLGCWLIRYRRLSGVCLVVALLAFLVGAVVGLNPFCIAGYIAPDGSCAEE